MDATTASSEKIKIQSKACLAYQRTCYFIAFSAMAPVLSFMVIILVVSANNMETGLEYSSYAAIYFIFAILCVQLFFACFILLLGYLRRTRPTLKYHIGYTIFHLIVMPIFIVLCFLVTMLNEALVLSILILIGGISYFCLMYYNFKINRDSWAYLKAAF